MNDTLFGKLIHDGGNSFRRAKIDQWAAPALTPDDSRNGPIPSKSMWMAPPSVWWRRMRGQLTQCEEEAYNLGVTLDQSTTLYASDKLEVHRTECGNFYEHLVCMDGRWRAFHITPYDAWSTVR
jgi:hypothetical protein